MLSHANYHFCEQVTDGGVIFDYKLKQGPSTTRNAIKLLELTEFAQEIVRDAMEIASDYKYGHFN